MTNRALFSKKIMSVLIWTVGVSFVEHATAFEYFRKLSAQVVSRFMRSSFGRRNRQRVFSIEPAIKFSAWQLRKIPHRLKIYRPDIDISEVNETFSRCHRILVVENEPVGGCSYQFDENGGSGQICALGVNKLYRGNGYGGILLRHALNDMDRRGIRIIRLQAEGGYNNLVAMRLYEKHGFEVYYQGPDCDSPLMVRKKFKSALT